MRMMIGGFGARFGRRIMIASLSRMRVRFAYYFAFENGELIIDLTALQARLSSTETRRASRFAVLLRIMFALPASRSSDRTIPCFVKILGPLSPTHVFFLSVLVLGSQLVGRTPPSPCQ